MSYLWRRIRHPPEVTLPLLIVVLYALMAWRMMLGIPTVHAEGIHGVVMGFVACSPRKMCEYHELEAPSLMACIMGQGVAAKWLNDNGKLGYTLPRGFKCYVGHTPGLDIPV